LDERLEEAFRAAEIRFRETTYSEARLVSWCSVRGRPTSVLVEEACRADLLVVGVSKETNPYGGPDVGEVCLSAGRPVLVVPPHLEVFEPDRVLVAWNDTRESRRALLDGVPFLARASHVTVLQICGHTERRAAAARLEDLSGYLRQHGVRAEVKTRDAGGLSVAAAILATAGEARIDLLVAGAYGHRRMRGLMLGGVSRVLVDEAPIPCLLSS
jgi:nucleotide-binding universal stress UspA family protein